MTRIDIEYGDHRYTVGKVAIDVLRAEVSAGVATFTCLTSSEFMLGLDALNVDTLMRAPRV